MQNRMRYREQKYYCGQYLEVNLFPVWERVYKSGRRARRKPTGRIQKKLNQHNSERTLERIIHANFTHDDCKLELTYSDMNHPDSIERAKKDIQNFFKRVKRARAKIGLPEVKYIYSLEQGSKKGRLHFHVIMSGGLSVNQIAGIWGKGYVDKVLPLMFTETGCTGIAKYFCKQQVKDENGAKSKRWVSSQNLIRPHPVNNDCKFSKRKIRELAGESENARMFEALYPGYFFTDCKPFYNDDSGLHYLYLRMYRKDAVLDVQTSPRPRKGDWKNDSGKAESLPGQHGGNGRPLDKRGTPQRT